MTRRNKKANIDYKDLNRNGKKQNSDKKKRQVQEFEEAPTFQ